MRKAFFGMVQGRVYEVLLCIGRLKQMKPDVAYKFVAL
jgi:hypothetical protein